MFSGKNSNPEYAVFNRNGSENGPLALLSRSMSEASLRVRPAHARGSCQDHGACQRQGGERDPCHVPRSARGRRSPWTPRAGQTPGVPQARGARAGFGGWPGAGPALPVSAEQRWESSVRVSWLDQGGGPPPRSLASSCRGRWPDQVAILEVGWGRWPCSVGREVGTRVRAPEWLWGLGRAGGGDVLLGPISVPPSVSYTYVRTSLPAPGHAVRAATGHLCRGGHGEAPVNPRPPSPRFRLWTHVCGAPGTWPPRERCLVGGRGSLQGGRGAGAKEAGWGVAGLGAGCERSEWPTETPQRPKRRLLAGAWPGEGRPGPPGSDPQHVARPCPPPAPGCAR